MSEQAQSSRQLEFTAMDNGSSGPPLEHPKHLGTWLTHLDGSEQFISPQDTFTNSQLFPLFEEAWVGKDPQQPDSLHPDILRQFISPQSSASTPQFSQSFNSFAEESQYINFLLYHPENSVQSIPIQGFSSDPLSRLLEDDIALNGLCKKDTEPLQLGLIADIPDKIIRNRRLNPCADGYSPTIPPTDEEPSLCGSSVPSANPSPGSSVPFTNPSPRSSLPCANRSPNRRRRFAFYFESELESEPDPERKSELDPESESEPGSQLEPESQFESEPESESEPTERDALSKFPDDSVPADLDPAFFSPPSRQSVEDGPPQLQETGNSGLCNPVHLRTPPTLYPSHVRGARDFLSSPVDTVREWEANYKEPEGLIMRISEIDSAAGMKAMERGYAIEIANGEEAKIEKSLLGERVKLDLGEVERRDHPERLNFSQGPDGNDDHKGIEFTTTAVNISNDLQAYHQTTQPVFKWLSKTIENSPPISSLQSTSETPNPDDSISMKTPRNDDCSPGAMSCDSGWWSEDSSDDIDLMVPSALVPFVKKGATQLFQAFETWRQTPNTQSRSHTSQSNQGIDSCNTSASASTSPNTAASITPSKGDGVTKTPGKRPPGDDDEDKDERRPAQRRRLNPSSEDINNRLLACPFAKNNPVQHRKCFKYVLQEIARLKQHLMRVHQTPIHCVRCSEIFGTEEERDSHLRQQPECTVQPPRAWDGINESKRRQLAKRISSKKTKEENWYLIYQILFPESHLPESPFVDDINLSEELQALREFASQEVPSRIATFVRSDLPSDLRPNQAEIESFTQAAVRDVFNTLVERWQSGQGASQQSSPVQSTPTNADSGYRSGEPSSAGNRSSTPSPPGPPDTSATIPTDGGLLVFGADGAPITTSPIGALSDAGPLAGIGDGDSFGLNPDWIYPISSDDGFAQLFTVGLN